MRKALAALAALLIASTAHAGRTAIIVPSSYYNAVGSGTQQVGYWNNVARSLGCDVDVLKQSQTPTSQIKTGTIAFGGGITRTYSTFIHVGWITGASGAVNAPGYNPDSLWLADGWSSVPQIFCGPTTVSGNSIFTNSAACSTGIATLNGAFSSNNSGMSQRTYMMSGPELWCESSQGTAQFYHQTNRVGVPTSGVSRIVIGMGAFEPVNNYQVTQNADGTVVRPSQATADTFALYARYRADASGNGTGAPIIFCWPNAGNGSNPSTVTMAQAIAMADSASGGQVIGQVQGWKPKKIAVYVSRAFSRGSYRAAATSQEARGFFCVADTCDSTSGYKPTIDSLAALNIPITVGVNIDSVATYPYEKAWWDRIPGVEYSPETWSGVSTSVGDSLAVTPMRQPDAWGRRRTRTLVPVGRLPGVACADGDTSLSCILTLARNRLAQQGFSSLSRAIMAPESDYLSLAYNRGNLPSADTLGVALLSAQYDHVIINPDAASVASFTSFSVNGSGTVQPAITDVFALSAQERRHDIYTPTSRAQKLGTLSFVACRGFVDDPQTSAGGGVANPMISLNGSGHPWANEFAMGVFTPGAGPWYGADSPYYFHTFRTPLSVWLVRAGGLGPGKSTIVGNLRPEWYYTKWMVNSMRAINRLAGRNVVTFVQVDEL